MAPSFLVSPKEETKTACALELELSAGIGLGAALVAGGRVWSPACRIGAAAPQVKRLSGARECCPREVTADVVD